MWQRAHKGQLSAAASWLGRASVIIVTGVACMFYTVGVGGAVDAGIRLGFQASSEVVTNVTGRTPADLVGSTMIDYVWYPAWLDATFGQDEAPRNEYAARLWKAGTFTVEEQTAINADPGTSKAKIDERREQYKAIMIEMQDKYPQTYRRAAGMDTGGALWSTLPGAVGNIAAGWFLGICLVLMALGSAIARVAVGLYPFVAIPAVFHWLHHLAAQVAAMVVWAAWRGVVAGFAFFAYLVSCIGWVLRGTADPFVKTAAILLISAAMFAVMRRFNVIPQSRRSRRRSERRTERRRTDRRGGSRSGYSGFDQPRRPDQPQGGGGGSALAPVVVPGEAQRTARPPDVDDLGHLRSAKNPNQAKHTARAVAEVAATKSHPAVAAGVATVHAVKGAKDSRSALPSGAKAAQVSQTPAAAPDPPRVAPAGRKPGEVGPAAPRRALPVSQAKAPAVNPAPRTYQDAVNAGNSRAATPLPSITSGSASTGSAAVSAPRRSGGASGATIPGTVVHRGIHTPVTPSTPTITNPREADR